MKNLSRNILVLLVIANFFRISPIPHQITMDEPMQPGRVIAEPSWQIGYASKDGSFMFLVVAGCLPWHNCGINEPTDWWIGDW